ncbi:MAG TPA: SPOR domain-containing protein [Candidatus Binataceae bacterium]|nr:SPOR domain-containing protein [Candidatus Binataceae bacterium]
MRFEIGIGGGLVIGLGLLALSGGVFCLGLIGGYEIANQDQHDREVAAVYPLPAAPLPQTLPEGSPGVSLETLTAHAAGAASPTPGASEIGSGTLGGVPAAAAVSAPSANTSKRVAVASPAQNPLSDTEESAPPALSTTPPKPPHSQHKLTVHKAPVVASHEREPYSVQIDAVMDRQGAENMARKLSAGGYEPYIVPTEINGQTWYKVRVGHYDSEEEAHDAEERLRSEYEGALPTH